MNWEMVIAKLRERADETEQLCSLPMYSHDPEKQSRLDGHVYMMRCGADALEAGLSVRVLGVSALSFELARLLRREAGNNWYIGELLQDGYHHGIYILTPDLGLCDAVQQEIVQMVKRHEPLRSAVKFFKC
jgi:hypothetical protein